MNCNPISTFLSSRHKDVLTKSTTVKGIPVKFKEKTIPSGTFKTRFFQDMGQSGGFPSFFLLFRSFYEGDTYVALPGGFKTLDRLVRYDCPRICR